MNAKSWYRIELPPADQVKNGKADQMQKAFEVMFTAAGRPKGAVIFEWFGDGSEANMFYISPSGVELISNLIQSFGGAPCMSPLHSDRLVFIAGDENALGALPRGVGDRK